MSKLDDELARAIEEPAPAVALPKPATEAKPPSDKADRGERSSARNIGLLAGLLGIVAVVVGVVMFGFNDAAIWSLPLKDFKADQGKLVGRRVRLEAELVTGTMRKRDQPCEYRFEIMGRGPGGDEHKLPVRYGQCVVPDAFRDVPGVQLNIEGALNKEGHFEATLIMAQCSSKYDPSTHQMKPDTAEAGNTPVN